MTLRLLLEIMGAGTLTILCFGKLLALMVKAYQMVLVQIKLMKHLAHLMGLSPSFQMLLLLDLEVVGPGLYLLKWRPNYSINSKPRLANYGRLNSNFRVGCLGACLLFKLSKSKARLYRSVLEYC